MSIQKNTAYNLVGALLPLGLSLVTIPLYISLIGDARYGVLAIAWLLLGYFGLFDLGLGAATAQRIASLEGNSPKHRAEIFWTALLMNSGLGLVGGLLIWPIAIYFFSKVFTVDDALRPELASAIPWLILAVPLATVSGVLSGALQGRTKFLEINIISVLSSVLIQLVPLAVVWLHGPDLAWLLPATILARVFILMVLFLRCRVHVFQGQPKSISPSQAKGLLQYGGWITVTSLVSPMMVILDRFVIGATLDAKAVTYYTVPFQLAERSAVLPAALQSALFPRLAAASKAESRELAATAILSLAVVMTPLMVIGILLIEPFLRWWLNPGFAAHAGLTGEILLIGFWFNAFARVPYAQLQAAGRPDLVAKCHLGELAPYLVLLYAGLHFWGLTGAAVAFGLRTLFDCVLLSWFSGTLTDIARVLYLPLLLLVAALGITFSFSTGTQVWWMLAVGLLFLSLAWSWRCAPWAIRALGIRLWKKFVV